MIRRAIRIIDAILAVQPFFPVVHLNAFTWQDRKGRIIPALGESHVEQRWHLVASRLEEHWRLRFDR